MLAVDNYAVALIRDAGSRRQSLWAKTDFFTPFDPVTLTFDPTLPKNVATGGKAKAMLVGNSVGQSL